MRITAESVADGIRERLFTLGEIPGVLWTPAAVLGLVGSEWLVDTAARITVPVEFVLQWDDRSNHRDAVMRLFDALGSAEKTLHANPGGHFRVPPFEIDSAVRFFVRHLRRA